MDDKATICPWCGNPVTPDEPRVQRDGEWFHLSCSAEEMEDATFDRDMGFA